MTLMTARDAASTTRNSANSNTNFKFSESSLAEYKIIMKMFFPIAMALTLQILPQAISFSFVGHLPNSTQLLAGSGLARIFTNVTATSFALGLTTGLQTLISQAIGNKNQLQKPYLIALYIQQCFYVSIFVLVPLTILQFFSGSIMLIIGQPSELCPIVSEYCRALIPYLWLTNILMIVNRTGRAFMLNTEIMIIFFIGAVFNFCCNYLFIVILGYSYLFTAIALDLTQLIDVFLIICLLIYRGHSYIFKPLPLKNVLKWKDGIWTYLKLTFPSLIQIASCWWITEFIVLFTGFISVKTSVALSAVTIATMINAFAKLITIGMSTPITIRVGQYIGAGSIIKAKLASRVGFMYIDIFVLIGLVCFIFFTRDILPTIWTSDQEVINLVSDMLCTAALFQIPFNIFFYVGSVYRGLGLQKYAACILFLFQYILGIPLNIVLLFYFDFRHYLIWGSLSIWCVVVFAYSLATVTFLIHLFCFLNWKTAVLLSQSRIDKALLIKQCSNHRVYGSTEVTIK